MLCSKTLLSVIYKGIIFLFVGMSVYSCQHIAREFVISQNPPSNLIFSEDSLSVDYIGTAYFETVEASELYKEGIMAKFNNDFPRAEIKLKAALKLEPDNYSVLSGLGNLYVDENRLSTALEYYNRAINVTDSLYPGIFLNISRVYAAQGELDKALANIEYGAQIGKKEDYILQIMTYYQLTKVKLALLDCEGAERSFRTYETLTRNDVRFNAQKKGVLKYLVHCTGKGLREKYYDPETGELLVAVETLFLDMEEDKQWATLITVLPYEPSGTDLLITKEFFRDYLYNDFYNHSEIAASGITGKRGNTLYALADLTSTKGLNRARITYKLDLDEKYSNFEILKVTYSHPEENIKVPDQIK